MSFGETITRWAIIIGFALLAVVTALAGVLLLTTPQPQGGNPTLLLAIAVISAALALWLHRRLRRLKSDAARR